MNLKCNEIRKSNWKIVIFFEKFELMSFSFFLDFNKLIEGPIGPSRGPRAWGAWPRGTYYENSTDSVFLIIKKSRFYDIGTFWLFYRYYLVYSIVKIFNQNSLDEEMRNLLQNYIVR